jgi:hypothetical protein
VPSHPAQRLCRLWRGVEISLASTCALDPRGYVGIWLVWDSVLATEAGTPLPVSPPGVVGGLTALIRRFSFMMQRDPLELKTGRHRRLIFEPRQCIERVVATNGTFYSACKKP